MRKPFDGTYTLTQKFNDSRYRENYFKFGLLGHNGLDYGMPTQTTLLAPHDGVIKEAAFDMGGYGCYYKIENEIEGSILAHLQDLPLAVGTKVKEGEFVGKSDNTGNSTGPHLHWGYYRIPRNRDNGFNGYIDQTDWLNRPIVPPYNCDDIKAELDQLKLSQSSAIKQAVDSAISENNTIWQSKLDSANLTISQLQSSLSEQVKFSTLIGIMWKKLTGGGT